VHGCGSQRRPPQACEGESNPEITGHSMKDELDLFADWCQIFILVYLDLGADSVSTCMGMIARGTMHHAPVLLTG
jgi:hypothetical protein